MSIKTLPQADRINIEADGPGPAAVSNAARLAAQIRRLADFVEDNPELVHHLSYTFNRMLVPGVRTRENVATFARAGVAARAKVSKHQGDNWAGVDIRFGPDLSLHVYVDREEICERVVTGTREVTEMVPDPEHVAAAPLVEKTTVVEDVEWVCHPILADEAGTALPADGDGHPIGERS